MYVFFKLSWGSVWGCGESVWASGGPVWLDLPIDSLTWPLFQSPGFVFRPVLANMGQNTARLRAKLAVFGQKWRVSEQSSSFLPQKLPFWGKDGPSPRYTRPSWDARGYTHPSWKGDSHRRLATDPLRGSGPWMAQVDGRWTICNGSTTWIQPRMAQVDVINLLP